MSKFYSHLVQIDSLIVELDSMDFSESEKHQLAKLIDSNLHHTILDAILSELPEADKKIFLEHLNNEDHDKIWQLLNEKVENIEAKIKKAAEDLKQDMRQDIEETKRLKR